MSVLVTRTSIAQVPSPEAFDFYIATTGSDDNAGTDAEPWAITALNTKRATYAGMRVGIKDGTYDLSAMNAYDGATSESSSPIFNIAEGISGSPTIIKAVNHLGAVFQLRADGGTGARNDLPAIGQGPGGGEAGYVTIDGIEIKGGAFWLMVFWGGAANNRSAWSPGVTVKNCWLHDSVLPGTDNNPAIWLNTCINPTVRNNKFSDITDGGSGYGPCAVMTLSVRGLVMEYNTCSANMRVFLHDKHNDGGAGGYASDGFIVRYNYITGCSQYAIIGLETEYNGLAPDDTYQDCEIHNNVIVGCNALLQGKGANPTRMSITLHHNTWVQTGNVAGGDGVILMTSVTTSDKIGSHSNIFYRGGFTAGAYGEFTYSTGCMGPLSNNCYSASMLCHIASPINTFDGGTSYDPYNTLAGWQAALQSDGAAVGSRDDDSIQDDPEFAMTEGGAADYKLGPTSPCLNAGLTGHIGAWDGVVTQIGCDF